MKRIIPILLLILQLTGCGSSEVPDAMAPTPLEATAATAELVSLYDADSEIEQQTGGAVRAYPLGDGAKTDLMIMGDKLLVVFDDGILTLLQGELGEVAATGIADLAQDRTGGELIAWSDGVMYFDENSRETVILDAQLQESLRVALPEQSQGNPVLQSSGEVFYCTGSEIRALDIRSGISRLVRQHNCTEQELTGSYFDDKVIGCRITDETGAQRIIYLYADTGEAVQEDTTLYRMETGGQWYFASKAEDETPYIFGRVDAEPMCLYPAGETVESALLMHGAVGYAAAEDGLHLSFYDFNSGIRTAEVTLNGVGTPDALTSDGAYIWLIAEGVLYRWDVSMTQIADETVYTDQRYTAESPDTEGLAECQSRVQQLQETYGLFLHIWQDAATLAKDYTLEEEYRVSVIQDSLDQIEGLLQQFPENFVKDTGNVTFCLVNTLKSGKTYEQYWDGATCTVVLSSQDVEKSFLMGLGVAIDTKVLGNSRDFDTWNDLNPRGFKYTYDYEANEERENADKYQDAFIDRHSMSFPTEDRSRIFAYAVLPEGAEYFTHDDLQDKLLRICEAIREAYDLEESTVIFPWEQYLDEPIAEEEQS